MRRKSALSAAPTARDRACRPLSCGSGGTIKGNTLSPDSHPSMKMSENVAGNSEVRGLYSLLPSLNDLLLTPGFAAILLGESRSTVVRSTRAVLHRIRQEISDGQHTHASVRSRVAALDTEV